MRYRYTKFDERLRRIAMQKRLKELFLELLMHTGGDVEEALEWLDELADRFGLFPEGMDLDHFREQMIDEGLIEVRDQPRGKGRRADPSRRRYKPTRKAERALRTDAFEELFSQLKADSLKGDHLTPYAGAGGDRLPETRPWRFGDRVQDIDTVASINNALIRHGYDNFRMTEDDLSVHEVEHATATATVLALDISHSMILYGEDRITPAKKVALGLAELIQTRFKKDSLEVVLFGDEAFQVDVAQLPFVQVGPYHTNTRGALQLGQRILARKRHANKQIVLITDGKASAITEGGRIYINSLGLDAKIVNKTVEEAQACRRKGILVSTFMITADPYLKQFVDRLTQAAKGRAFYADLDHLGRFVMQDYLRNRRKQV